MPWVQEILLIQSAMPAGIFAVVIVGNYGGDKLTALRTIPCHYDSRYGNFTFLGIPWSSNN
jgi:hypothetical protein